LFEFSKQLNHTVLFLYLFDSRSQMFRLRLTLYVSSILLKDKDSNKN